MIFPRVPSRPSARDADIRALDYVMLAFCVLMVSAIALLVLASVALGQTSRGLASWYWQPQRLACGGRLTGPSDQRMYAAHKTLPCGTRVRVTWGSSTVDVTIMDRGPFVRGRIIDLFPAPARDLGMIRAGVVPVNVEIIR